MAVELITGRAGQAHVSSHDFASLLRGIVGTGSYILGTKLPKISMATANSCSISACDLLLNGRHVALTGSNSVAVESGGHTSYRIDYVCVRYKRDVSLNIESAELVVVKGVPASSKNTAQVPNIPLTPEINATSQQVDVPIIQIDVDALTPTAKWIIPTPNHEYHVELENFHGGTLTLDCGLGHAVVQISSVRLAAESWASVATPEDFIPEKYRPNFTVRAALALGNAGGQYFASGEVRVEGGKVTIQNMGSVSSDRQRYGQVCWNY